LAEQVITPQPAWLTVLRFAERDGLRCGGPVILAGFVTGSGLVEVAAGPLGLASRDICVLMILLVLQLAGPLMVTVVALMQLAPTWLERVEELGPGVGRLTVPAAALVAPLLLTVFLVATLVSGALVTPRADLAGELGDVLSGIQLRDLLVTWLRTSVFFAIICAWCVRRCRLGLWRQVPQGEIVSELLNHGIVLIMLLKLVWIVAIDPINLQ
jgi:hypothetical protein